MMFSWLFGNRYNDPPIYRVRFDAVLETPIAVGGEIAKSLMMAGDEDPIGEPIAGFISFIFVRAESRTEAYTLARETLATDLEEKGWNARLEESAVDLICYRNLFAYAKESARALTEVGVIAKPRFIYYSGDEETG